jgi:DNA-binding HxlR family transcriptional regulator
MRELCTSRAQRARTHFFDTQYLFCMPRRKLDQAYGCPIEVALDVIGGKWKGMALHRLLQGTARFNELRRAVPGATQRMLTLQLRELERDGVISRTVYPEVPPRVEYRLTEFGRRLAPILQMMESWGVRYREEIRAVSSVRT